MKKRFSLRRTLSLGGSALLLAGLMTGLTAPGVLSVSAMADKVTAGNYYKVDATSLNVRSGPGLSYAIRDRLADNTIVEILETRSGWARMQKGWVSADYLRYAGSVMDSAAPTAGYVKATALNVRMGPGKKYPVCGQVTEGYRLNILEIQDGWGRIQNGWVKMRYVHLGSAPDYRPAPNPAPGPGYDYISSAARATVTAGELNIRQGPGENYAKVGSLGKGTQITVTEIQDDWGKTDRGWICLDYVNMAGSQNHNNGLRGGGTAEITADALNVRTGPGSSYPRCGMMTRGYHTTVNEIKDGWGRVNGGWICLDYVRWVQ